MSFSILRVEKVKGSNNTRGIQKHCQRENKNYQNPDIKANMTQFNYDLINDKNINYSEVIDEKIESNYSGKRKIRSDAIRHVDGIITSDSEFFKELDPSQERRFFQDSLEFLEKEYGKENMVYATVHVDEKTPHMHFGFVPLTEDGRLSAKEKLGNKKAMVDLQNSFNTFINEKGYDLERGVSKLLTQAEHQQMERLKKETDYHQTQFEEKQEMYERIDKDYETLVSDYQASLELLDKDVDIHYENELEQVTGFLGRVTDEFETGRIVMDKADFEQIKTTSKAGAQAINVLDQFQEQDFFKENKKLQKELDDMTDVMSVWKSEYEKEQDTTHELRQENHQLKIKNERLNRNNDKMVSSLVTLYQVARNNFKGFEQGFDAVSSTLAQKERTKPVSDFMEQIQQSVHEEDRKRQRKRSKASERGLEL